MRKPTKLPRLRRQPRWTSPDPLMYAAAVVILLLAAGLQLGLFDRLLS